MRMIENYNVVIDYLNSEDGRNPPHCCITCKKFNPKNDNCEHYKVKPPKNYRLKIGDCKDWADFLRV